MNKTTYIPERFRRVLELHIVKNLMTNITGRLPLLLGIHGASGDGKTFQCEQILSEIGVKAFLISGGQLESPDSGKPAQLVRDTYLEASDCIEKGKSRAAVMLINDIDTGLGNWGNLVQYTVNTQTVFGELMHLVDYPNLVEGIPTRRIPIIITGNDFTKLYEPLVRAGRMTAFEWKPTLEEKAKIVEGIFSEISPQECEAIVREFESQPVAFFCHLRASLIDEDLWKLIQIAGGTRKAIEMISAPYNPRQPVLHPTIRFEQIVQAGRDIFKSGQLINHLRSS
ncbi:MAG: AAA family ATPase [Planktothrix sp. GU0601_MAG3]|nr:MAG: AAA family ATPase [Planktothrix sp. GU0601_MAG3]